MPNTLTLATTSYYSGTYETTDNSSFSAVTAGTGAPVNFNANDTVTITGTGITATGFDTKAGNDSLIVNTTLTATTAAPIANKSVILGGGNDIAKVNANVTGYNFQAGGGNDTLVISTGVTATNTIFSGSIGSDLIAVQGTINGGQIAATGASPSPTTEGNDTIVFATGSVATDLLVTQFTIANDTLIIGGTFDPNTFAFSGGTVINAADFTLAGATAGTYTQVTNTGGSADITLLNAWLAAGGNRITLI